MTGVQTCALPILWREVPDFSLTPHIGATPIGLRALDGTTHEIGLAPDDRLVEVPADGWAYVAGPPSFVAFVRAGHTHLFEVVDRSELWAPSVAERAGTGSALVAPFPALVAEVHVAPGDAVEGGQVLVVIEAMKMLHGLTADGAESVEEVLVAPGDQVTGAQVLVTFTTEIEES